VEIHITGLTKVYRGGTRALDSLDLTVPTGMFGLLGANGAGKTTLMRILAGLLRPSGGRVLVADHDLATAQGRAGVKRVLGYLPQDLGVYPDLTAGEFLDYVALLKGIDDRAVRRRRVAELLEVVALSDVAKHRLKGFSGGMKRRIGIAQALLNDPRLLIVDEPTAGLDPEERIRFRTLLAQLAGDRTVLLSTHIVEDIAQTCRELAVLDAGRPVFRGTVANLTAVADGRVWSVVTTGPEPEGGVIVSVLPDPRGVRYRVVAAGQPAPDAVSVAPSLEEGYLALRDARTVRSA
jgi:ABC-2 type transport system ATP-binding protein